MTEDLDALRVNHAALDMAAENMYATVKRMDESLNSLESDLEPYRREWSGEQQQSYTQAKQAWDFAMQEMRDLLDKSKETVYQSNAEYQAADRRGANRFIH